MQDAGAVTAFVAEGHRSALDWSSDGRRMLVISNLGLRSLERDGFFRSVPFGRSCDIGVRSAGLRTASAWPAARATGSTSSAPQAFAGLFQRCWCRRLVEVRALLVAGWALARLCRGDRRG